VKTTVAMLVMLVVVGVVIGVVIGGLTMWISKDVCTKEEFTQQ
jgi:uncharacterized protein YneF (UPF0154 family)